MTQTTSPTTATFTFNCAICSRVLAEVKLQPEVQADYIEQRTLEPLYCRTCRKLVP